MKKNILYIEDDRDIAEAVQIILKNAGFNINIAFSGNEGLKQAEKGGFDMFLLDIMLPDMSGYDIFIELKKLYIKARYVFLSAIPVSAERMRELVKDGVSDYITKPFAKEDLIRRINILF